MTFLLDDRAVITLSGPEARDFLQGLVTNDVRRVSPGALRYAALLTPQGKILYDFLLGEWDGALFIDCPRPQRDALARRLSLYKLRAKVDITPRDDLVVVWSRNEQPSPFVRDTRHPDLGWRAVLPREGAPPQSGAGEFASLRLACGVPEGGDFGHDRMFALDADLDELGGIAFDKGCYVGQELTARMKHRGTARKRLLPVSAARGETLAPPETPVMALEREIGTISSVYGEKGFALVRLDRLDESRDATLTVDGRNVDIVKPDWLFP